MHIPLYNPSGAIINTKPLGKSTSREKMTIKLGSSIAAAVAKAEVKFRCTLTSILEIVKMKYRNPSKNSDHIHLLHLHVFWAAHIVIPILYHTV